MKQSKKEKAMSQIRKGNIDNFSMSEDFGLSAPLAVALFTPDMENTMNHYHIEFNRKQATKLRDWLSNYLKKTKKK